MTWHQALTILVPDCRGLSKNYKCDRPPTFLSKKTNPSWQRRVKKWVDITGLTGAGARIDPLSNAIFCRCWCWFLRETGLMSASPKWVRPAVSAIARSNCSTLYAPVLKASVSVCRSRQSDIRCCFDRRRTQKSTSGEMLPQLIGELYLLEQFVRFS